MKLGPPDAPMEARLALHPRIQTEQDEEHDELHGQEPMLARKEQHVDEIRKGCDTQTDDYPQESFQEQVNGSAIRPQQVNKQAAGKDG